jgi:hypothetical protein
MSTIKGRNLSNWAKSGLTRSHACGSRINENKFRLLNLEEILDLDTTNDAVFTLKIFYFALEMATEFAAAEYGDLDLRCDVLAICEAKIRHGHTFSLACMSAVFGEKASLPKRAAMAARRITSKAPDSETSVLGAPNKFVEDLK